MRKIMWFERILSQLFFSFEKRRHTNAQPVHA